MSAYLGAADHARGRAAMVEHTGRLLEEPGTMPSAVEPTVERLTRQWTSGTPNAAELAQAKAGLRS